MARFFYEGGPVTELTKTLTDRTELTFTDSDQK